MSSRRRDDDDDAGNRMLLMIIVFVLGIVATLVIMLLAIFQVMDFALVHSNGSPFGMMCGLFSAMGMIAVIWILIFILMWFIGFPPWRRQRPRRPLLDWQV
jgi:uncharacterized membrane protein